MILKGSLVGEGFLQTCIERGIYMSRDNTKEIHIGDKVTVKVTDIDDQGRINLTTKGLNEPKVYEED